MQDNKPLGSPTTPTSIGNKQSLHNSDSNSRCKCLGKWHTNCRSPKTRPPKLQTNANLGYQRNHQNYTRQTNEINLLSCLHCSQDAQAESTYFSIIRLPTTRTLGGHLYGSIRQIVLKALTDFNIWWYLSIHMQEQNMSIFWHQHWISCMLTSAWHRTSKKHSHILRSDQGTEIKNSSMTSLLEDNHTNHIVCCGSAPKTNPTLLV